VTDGLVSCFVGERQYAMRDSDILEIVRIERMRRATRGDRTVGTLVVGGETIAVFSLAAILDGVSGSGTSAPTGHHIVVTHGTYGAIGWLADRIVRSHLTDGLDVLPLPAVMAIGATAWFEGLLIVDGAPLPLLSPKNLDPRATRGPANADAPAPAAVAAAPSAPFEDAGPALVVMFSSPALPPSGAARYALSARRIEAVVQSLAVTPVPGSPAHVTGVAVWRGDVMPVVDFRSGSDRTMSVEGNRYLIARCGRRLRGGSVAFAVDSELGLHKPTPDDREADEIESTPPFIVGTFNVLGNRLALLDLDTLLLTAGQ
jgi:chemotaxis signal transduction protein